MIKGLCFFTLLMSANAFVLYVDSTQILIGGY
jgi:hypothetical protein